MCVYIETTTKINKFMKSGIIKLIMTLDFSDFVKNKHNRTNLIEKCFVQNRYKIKLDGYIPVSFHFLFA